MYSNATFSATPFAIFCWLVFYLILFNIDLSFISGSLAFDSNMIEDMASTISLLDEQGSYYSTALFFSYIPPNYLSTVVFMIGSLAIIVFMKDLQKLNQLFLAMYITLPCIILFLSRPQKESVTTLILICLLYVFRSNYSYRGKIIITVMMYSFYAYFFRQYYFIIIATFLVILIFTNVSIGKKFIMFGIFILALLIIPEHVFFELQGKRDIINALRQFDIGTRTAFTNYMYPNGAGAFIINYIYAFLRLNIPILFYLGYKEIWLLSVVFIYMYYIYIGMKSTSEVVRLCSTLLISHIAVYMLFEPDLGSYARHLSSNFIYLTPVLVNTQFKQIYHSHKTY